MSASTQAAPKQMSFGRMPSTLAMLALVFVIAVAVALVALNGTKAAAPVTSGAKGAPPPAVIDHGWSSAAYGETETILPYNDHGWSQAGTSKAPGTGAVGYPPFGASYFPKTIDSPYVAPRPRNQ